MSVYNIFYTPPPHPIPSILHQQNNMKQNTSAKLAV